jgi:FxsC-like protein
MVQPIFLSYASENRDQSADCKVFDRFVEALETELAGLLGCAAHEVLFKAYRDIQVGDEWPSRLDRALDGARLLLYMDCPHYFNSPWCGREFEIFRRRRAAWSNRHGGQAPAGTMLPVRWIPGNSHAVAQPFQFTDAAFPPQYSELGARKLLHLGRTAQWRKVVAALAVRLKEALDAPPLPAVLPPPGPVHEWPSAFSEAPPAPHAVLAAAPAPISSRAACFVFLAPTQGELAEARVVTSAWDLADGWGWRPFHPQMDESVGALAQRAAGDRNLRFTPFACDQHLIGRLKAARDARVPVVIFADPWCLKIAHYRKLLGDYDDVNLLNCAVLVPWNRDDPHTAAEEERLLQDLRQVCWQKVAQGLPGHHWRIGSSDELRERARTVLDEITMRLVDHAGAGELRRAQSAELAAAALTQGIRTDTQPNLVASDRSS